jgi:hypothetical protein
MILTAAGHFRMCKGASGSTTEYTKLFRMQATMSTSLDQSMATTPTTVKSHGEMLMESVYETLESMKMWSSTMKMISRWLSSWNSEGRLSDLDF